PQSNTFRLPPRCLYGDFPVGISAWVTDLPLYLYSRKHLRWWWSADQARQFPEVPRWQSEERPVHSVEPGCFLHTDPKFGGWRVHIQQRIMPRPSKGKRSKV